jgi:hypothetical protein
VSILKHHYASKSSAAVCEEFSNAYPDKVVPNRTTVHQLLTKFRVGACFREGGVHFQHLL